MMAASAISGVFNVAPASHRDARKASISDNNVLHNRMVKHGRTSEVMHPKDWICSCGLESAALTSNRRVLLPPITHRKLGRKLSMKEVSRQVWCRMSLERVAKPWGMDLHVDGITESIRRQKRRAALAALAVAGCVSIMLPSSSALAEEALVVDFPAPSTSVEALEAQFTGNSRKELEKEAQVQRNEWDGASVGATAPSPTQSRIIKNIEVDDPFYAWRQVQREMGVETAQEVVCVNLVQTMEEDSFYAWRQVGKEMGYVGAPPVGAACITPAMLQSMEDDPFYAWRQIQKEMAPLPKSPVKKAVAASVAVAVAGSVAGAASAAGRAVASSGGTSVVATSLTVLQHSALPGSTLLARIVQHLGGGGVAGAIGATAVYPLDTIKTRMQAQSLEGEKPQYKDEIDCFKQLVINEGPASLYSGLVPQLLGIAPEKAMKLTVNEALLSSLETMMPGARVWALEFIAGGGGGASQVVFTNPMEIVKVRLQTQKDGAPKKALWTIVKELGVTGLYDGAGVTLARDVPSSAIFFAIYTLLRGLYPEQSFLAGAIAAIPATVLVTPMDIIKTRLQKEPAPGEPQYTDWWDCMQDLIAKEGFLALFKGSLLRVLRTSPQFGITLMIYGILCDGS